MSGSVILVLAAAISTVSSLNPYIEHLAGLKYDNQHAVGFATSRVSPAVQQQQHPAQQMPQQQMTQHSFAQQQPATPQRSPTFEPVVFSAVRAKDATRKAGSQIQFESMLTDIGYGWDSFSKSQFVCYHPGVYLFTFTALSPANSMFRVSLMHNSKEAVSIWGDRNGHNSASATVILTLDRGDVVYLAVKEGNIFENSSEDRAYTTFSGFRMGELTSQ